MIFVISHPEFDVQMEYLSVTRRPRQFTGSQGESSGRSCTVLLNSEESCIQILAPSQAIVIVLCLLLVLNCVTKVACCSNTAQLLLRPWRLISGRPNRAHRGPSRLPRTTTRARRWISWTPETRRTGICLPVQQVPNTCSNMT